MGVIYQLPPNNSSKILTFPPRSFRVHHDFSAHIYITAHHPRFGIMLEKQMKKLGVECALQYPGYKNHNYKNMVDFFIKKLNQHVGRQPSRCIRR